MPNLGGWEIVILLVVVVLIFGAKRLPEMARSIGQSARVFKGEISGLKKEHDQGTPDVPLQPTGEPLRRPDAGPAAPPARTVRSTHRNGF